MSESLESLGSSGRTFERVAKWTVSFGKYKGLTYGEIVANDPSYAKWLITIIRSEKVKEYLSFATASN